MGCIPKYRKAPGRRKVWVPGWAEVFQTVGTDEESLERKEAADNSLVPFFLQKFLPFTRS